MIKPRPWCASLLVFAALTAAFDHGISARPAADTAVVITNRSPDDLRHDAFTIEQAEIHGARLHLIISSGGGCRGHDYELLMTPAVFMESYPVQANLYLWHDAHDDPCDAIVRDSLVFDLGPIGRLYAQMYGPDGQVYLNLHDFEQTSSTRLVYRVR
ncbi:MAG TPA: hypothetical protein VNN55_11330 [bacterium]|nr:hypothetical protein [bacterium]